MKKTLLGLFFFITSFYCLCSTEDAKIYTSYLEFSTAPEKDDSQTMDTPPSEGAITSEIISSASSDVGTQDVPKKEKETKITTLSFDEVTEIIMKRDLEQYRKNGRSMFF